MSELKIIDIHCHYQKTEGFLAQMLEAGQAAGVRVFCLNGGGPRWLQHGNDAVLAAAEAYPGVIIPFAFCALGEHNVADVYAWHRAGFRGLKVQCPPRMYDDEAFFPIYAAAEECRLPILFHTGISARFPNHDFWNTSSRFMMPLTLDRIARCFPGLTIWGAHLGVPDTYHAAMLMRIHPHVYFDLCGLEPREKHWTTLRRYEEMFFSPEHFGKLVFGSEGSPAGFAPLVATYQAILEKYALPDDIRLRVFWGNAAEALEIFD